MIFQISKIDDFSDVGAIVDVEMVEVTVPKVTLPKVTLPKVELIGEDLSADNWILWVKNKPKKNSNAPYIYPFDPDWHTYWSQFHDDHSYSNKTAGEEIYNLKKELKEQEEEFQTERQKFEAEKKRLKFENFRMKKQLNKAQKDLKTLQDTSTTKGNAYMEEMVRLRLKDHFSEATLDLILDKNRTFSKKWTNKDFSFAMLLKMISPQALKLLRTSKLLPLPSNSTIKRKFSFMNVTQGEEKCEFILKILIALLAREFLFLNIPSSSSKLVEFFISF